MKPLVFGHRGASAYAPENTLAAFNLAFDLGADGVELDVTLTKAGVPVVIHDDTVDRTTNGRGAVKQMTLEQVQLLDAGVHFEKYHGEKIPTLVEVLTTIAPRGIVNIELKSGKMPEVGLEVAAIARVVAETKTENHVIVSSFNYFALHCMAHLNDRLPRGMLYFNRVPLSFSDTELRPYARPAAVHPKFVMVTLDLVRWARSRGYQINTWTVDEPDEMRRLIALGVDSIMTNQPDVLRQIIG